MTFSFWINTSCSSSPTGGNQVDGLPPVIKFGCSTVFADNRRAQIRKSGSLRSKFLKICAVNFEIASALAFYHIEAWFDPGLRSSLFLGKKLCVRKWNYKNATLRGGYWTENWKFYFAFYLIIYVSTDVLSSKWRCLSTKLMIWGEKSKFFENFW